MSVVPAILASNVADFIKFVQMAKSFTDYVQIDLMDGDFVPSTSISLAEFSHLETGLKSEAHLMVRDPLAYLNACKYFGCHMIIFHHEAVSDHQRTIDAIRRRDFKVGLAVNPETKNTAFVDLVDDVDTILYMAVYPGFYGAPFVPEVLDKVNELRRNKPEARIGVDGGIKLDNARDVRQAGADYICVGSAIFKAEDPAGAYRDFLGSA